MITYGKTEGHHCWWLTINGESVSNFNNKSDIDGIITSIQNNLKSRQEFELLRKQLDEANNLINDLSQGINDSISCYAPEFCNKKDVEEAKNRINEFGRLAYFAKLNSQVEKFKSSQETN
jgi:hypothetical protein